MPHIEFNGAAIHYDIVDQRLPWQRGGGGDAIVFHHGLGARADMWCGWAGALAPRHRLLRMDMRGHGRSRVPARHPCTIDALADDLEAVVDHADLGRFHLVGESIGGTAALLFAARHPERVLTLTVSNGAHRGSGITNLSPWERIIADGGMRAWSAHMMQQRFFDGSIDDAAWRWYETQQAQCDRNAVLALAAALSAADLTAELQRVSMPVLLLHPDSSPFIPVGLMADLRERLADARLRVFARTRHGLPFSHAGECARELVGFLEALPPGVKS